LAQAGQWLARKFVLIWKFCARPSGSEAPPAPSRWDVSSNAGKRSAIGKRKKAEKKRQVVEILKNR